MERVKKLPGYEILGRIAEGGMASVWLARQLSLDRQVAIKMLSPDFVQDAEARQRFHLEAQAAARLNHPGIVQVYDAGEHEGSIYMVMEYVDGCSVADLLDRKSRLSERHALLIAEGIALALDYAWSEADLIHCDVKPENVLVAQDGAVKLTDLGLARLIGTYAAPDMIEGTPHYASPEQVRGELDLDCRTDIYSLGAMLYHLVTGSTPFGDSQGLLAMKRQLNDYLPDPSDLNHSITPGLAWLIEKMMVKDRTQRYATWSEVLSDIARVQADERPAGTPPTAGQSTVMRSEERTWSGARPATPSAEAASPPPQPVAAPPEEPKAAPAAGHIKVARAKQRITLPKGLRQQVAARFSPPSGRDLSREVVSLVLMLLAVLTSYGALAFYHLFHEQKTSADGQYWSGKAEPGSAAQMAAGLAARAPDPRSVATRTRPVSPAAMEKADAPAQDNPENWRHPTYLKGARLFNDALEKYTKYQKDKQNPEVLKTVEQQCREAIRAFEFVKPFAPKNLDIQRLIDQCYHLISDTRHSTLLLPASSSKKREPLDAITQTSELPPAQPGQEIDGLVRAPRWNAPQTGVSDRLLDDFAALLDGSAVANVDLNADTSLVIFGQVCYLMPAREAARIIGKPPGVRRRLNTPGFPKDSFHYYSLPGNFGNGFDQMYLITDSTDRIVAVQLATERTDKELWLDPQLFQDQWSTYNFIEAKTKANSKWKVALRMQKDGRVLRLDSELVSSDSSAYFGLGDSKSRVSLYLPEPIANLVLFRIAELQKR